MAPSPGASRTVDLASVVDHLGRNEAVDDLVYPDGRTRSNRAHRAGRASGDEPPPDVFRGPLEAHEVNELAELLDDLENFIATAEQCPSPAAAGWLVGPPAREHRSPAMKDTRAATARRQLAQLLRRMRLPYMRAAAPEVIATARSQALGALRGAAASFSQKSRRPRRATRASAAGGRASRREDFDQLDRPQVLHSRADPERLRSLEWVGGRRTSPSAARRAAASRTSCEAIATASSTPAMRVSWFSLESLTATLARAKVDARSQGSSPASAGRI